MLPPAMIQLTRDSVCMADDIDAPHEVLTADAHIRTLGELCESVVAENYLPRIVSSKISWILACENKPLVILGQSPATPVWWINSDAPLLEITAARPMKFQFIYCSRFAPEKATKHLEKWLKSHPDAPLRKFVYGR
jgi:hypothetical protein